MTKTGTVEEITVTRDKEPDDSAKSMQKKASKLIISMTITTNTRFPSFLTPLVSGYLTFMKKASITPENERSYWGDRGARSIKSLAIQS
uniref:Uncharacterized protein n=1 Tax=Candidatus Kentrum sp. LPFa TaxID=2126335 RepID=A0A450WWW4_9GAMM|nr:MAG: hypothetical protein BECKLPF1236B_GA0070989_12604 [Candidatus Kentron sp. LPFa]